MRIEELGTYRQRNGELAQVQAIGRELAWGVSPEFLQKEPYHRVTRVKDWKVDTGKSMCHPALDLVEKI